MHRAAITAAVAARLVAEQFPAWADLPVVPVAESGWDNRTYRLGDVRRGDPRRARRPRATAGPGRGDQDVGRGAGVGVDRCAGVVPRRRRDGKPATKPVPEMDLSGV
jgi:hypothetical protein